MNKKELIKYCESLKGDLNKFINVVNVDKIIAKIEQLDEPQAGHADEAPRHVKNVLARPRELPLHDREVWLKAIMDEFEQDFSRAKWREGYEQGKFEGAMIPCGEPQKPVVPQFVADWIEKCKVIKKFKASLAYALNSEVWSENSLSDECIDWLYNANNQELFARAWLDGYEVEKEKRYLVKMKDLKSGFNLLNRHKTENYWFFSSKDENVVYQVCHTRKELEEAGFGWIFSCEGMEVEEVEE